MIVAQHDAILALLQAVPALVVHDGAVIGILPPRPYVVLWASAPHRTSDRLAGFSDLADTTFSTTAVADSARDVAQVQEWVHAALLDAAVTVTGRVSQRIDHTRSAAAEVDYDQRPPVVTAVDAWRLVSVPA